MCSCIRKHAIGNCTQKQPLMHAGIYKYLQQCQNKHVEKVATQHFSTPTTFFVKSIESTTDRGKLEISKGRDKIYAFENFASSKFRLISENVAEAPLVVESEKVCPFITTCTINVYYYFKCNTPLSQIFFICSF